MVEKEHMHDRPALKKTPLDAIVLILNSAQIDRQISPAIQVQRLGFRRY